VSFNDYLDRQTGSDLKPAGPEQWRGFSGYATGATARSKQALVPADEGDVQTAEQVTLSMLANEPGHSFTYRHDLDHGRACNVVVEEITAVDPAGNDVAVFGDEPRP